MPSPPHRRTLRSGATAVLALSAVLLAACGITGEPEPDPEATVAPEPELASFYQQDIEWSDCGDGLECAQVEVPLDYAEPDGTTIELAVNRLPAFGGDRIGSLVTNPGGPGFSGKEHTELATTVVTREVREHFDVVGFDPRGVAESAPVRCVDDEELDEHLDVDGDPSSAAAAAEIEELNEEFAELCAEESGELLKHVGTPDAARDMDVLRAVLGDSELTYLGWSYGTELGATYGDLFPERVRALALDGGLDPAMEPMDMAVSRAQAFEEALESFVADCLDANDCPLRGPTVDAAVTEIGELRQDADAEPLQHRINDDVAVTGSGVLGGITTALYSADTWPMLRSALDDAITEADGTMLHELQEELMGRQPDGSWSNMLEASTAIRCSDTPQLSEEEAAEVAEEAHEVAPLFGEGMEWSYVQCAGWPVDAPEEPRDIDAAGAEPALVIGTQRDPATPYEWSVSLAETLDNARLLTLDGDGHGAYAMGGSTCVDEAVDRYLIEGELPEEGAICAPD